MPTADATEADEMLTVKEAAGLLKISSRQVYNLIHAGRITYHLYPGRTPQAEGSYRIKRSEVRRFKDATEVPATAP